MNNSDRMTSRMNKKIDELCNIAVEAGKLILKHFRHQPGPEGPCEPLIITQKEDNSPLTKADMESHHSIVNALTALDPTIPIISEESQLPDYEVRRHWTRFWLIDPLDGTKEFLNGSDDFTVNIALIENQEPTLGIVYIQEKTYSITVLKGTGAGNKKAMELHPEYFRAYPT